MSPEGQDAIAAYQIDGQQLFFPSAGRMRESFPGRQRRPPRCTERAQRYVAMHIS